MTVRAPTETVPNSVSYQLGEIKGLLAGILSEVNLARDRDKGFDNFLADHERRISQIEATRPDPRIAALEKIVLEISTRLKVYAAIVCVVGSVIAFVVHEVLSFVPSLQ